MARDRRRSNDDRAVCLSRVYLGLHYLSDVLGGVAEGIAWLAACWVVWHFAKARLGSGER